MANIIEFEDWHKDSKERGREGLVYTIKELKARKRKNVDGKCKVMELNKVIYYPIRGHETLRNDPDLQDFIEREVIKMLRYCDEKKQRFVSYDTKDGSKRVRLSRTEYGKEPAIQVLISNKNLFVYDGVCILE